MKQYSLKIPQISTFTGTPLVMAPVDTFFLVYHLVLSKAVLDYCMVNALGLMGSTDRRLRLQ